MPGHAGRDSLVSVPADRHTISLRIPTELYDALKGVAFVTNRSITDLINEAISFYLQDAGRQELVKHGLSRAQEQFRSTLNSLADL